MGGRPKCGGLGHHGAGKNVWDFGTWLPVSRAQVLAFFGLICNLYYLWWVLSLVQTYADVGWSMEEVQGNSSEQQRHPKFKGWAPWCQDVAGYACNITTNEGISNEWVQAPGWGGADISVRGARHLNVKMQAVQVYDWRGWILSVYLADHPTWGEGVGLLGGFRFLWTHH